MTGSKTTSLTSEQMHAALAQGQSRSDWERVRAQVQADAQASAEHQRIGALVARIEQQRRRGRPVVGEAKEPISLRLPHSVLARWRASGPGWQTRMAKALEDALPLRS